MIDRQKQPLLQQRMLPSRTQTTTTFSPNLRVAQLLTAMIVPLALVASAGGLFIGSLYRLQQRFDSATPGGQSASRSSCSRSCLPPRSCVR